MKRLVCLLLGLTGLCSEADAALLRLTPILGWISPDNRISYGVQAGLGGFPIGVEGEIYRIPLSDPYPAAALYSGGIRVQLPLPGRFSPYLAGGLGILRESHLGTTSSYFASNIGGGADVELMDHVSIQGEFRLFRFSSHADPSTFKRITIGLGLKF